MMVVPQDGFDEVEPWSGFRAAIGKAMNGRKTIGVLVYELVRDAIISGVLEPKQRLKQEELANAMGVSRIPVRTALMQLDSEGLVSFHPGKGAVVRSLTADQVREIYEIRELLEVHALHKSMVMMSSERLEHLRGLADALDDEDEGPGFTAGRVEFYRELYDAGNNPQLAKLIEDLRSGVGRYLLSRRISHEGFVGAHRALVECVSRGNLDEADAMLRAHLRTVAEGVERIVSGE